MYTYKEVKDIYTLNGRIGKAGASHTEGCGFYFTVQLAPPICTVQVMLRGYCPVQHAGVTPVNGFTVPGAIVLDGCGRLQLGVAHETTSVALLQGVDS